MGLPKKGRKRMATLMKDNRVQSKAGGGPLKGPAEASLEIST